MIKSTITVTPESASQRVRMVDMGCGLAYLSFAAHRHFSQRFPALRTVGVEGRLTLVEQTREVARNLGRDFDGLSFVNSSIMGYVHQLLLRNENHVIDGMYVCKYTMMYVYICLLCVPACMYVVYNIECIGYLIYHL